MYHKLMRSCTCVFCSPMCCCVFSEQERVRKGFVRLPACPRPGETALVHALTVNISFPIFALQENMYAAAGKNMTCLRQKGGSRFFIFMVNALKFHAPLRRLQQGRIGIVLVGSAEHIHMPGILHHRIEHQPASVYIHLCPAVGRLTAL